MSPITITDTQLEQWAGRVLTPEEIDRLAAAIPYSSIPDAIGTIVAEFDDETGDDDLRPHARDKEDPDQWDTTPISPAH